MSIERGMTCTIAKDIAQGSAVGGVGLLIDMAGNDRYRGLRRVQGQALGGVGILLDRAGKDDYHAAMWAQGFGGPLGFGVIDDLAGDDHYYCGGMWRTSYYPTTPGYEAWGQGIGAGLRQCGQRRHRRHPGRVMGTTFTSTTTSGKAGDTGSVRVSPAISAATIAVWVEHGRNTTASQRTQGMFARFTCGLGCHYALGFCFDDEGNDTYGGTIMGLGHAWDCSNGFLFDFAGDDHYEATGGLTQGDGAQAGLECCWTTKATIPMRDTTKAMRPPGISYHSLRYCGGNFSFLIDYGEPTPTAAGLPTIATTSAAGKADSLSTVPVKVRMTPRKIGTVPRTTS